MVTAVMPERLRKFSHGVSNEKEQDQKRSRTRHNLPDGDRHRAAVRRDVPSVWPTLDVQWPPKSRLSLETYLIGAAVLIGEAEGQLFTAYKLASFLGLARGTVQRKLDQLERVKAVERVSLKYQWAQLPLRRRATSITDLVGDRQSMLH
jgi:hypothetical protein